MKHYNAKHRIDSFATSEMKEGQIEWPQEKWRWCIKMISDLIQVEHEQETEETFLNTIHQRGSEAFGFTKYWLCAT